jgi:hypothetical protein
MQKTEKTETMNDYINRLAMNLYIAYYNSARGINHVGKAMPSWTNLPSETKAHWLMVARAAISELT